MGLDVYFCDFKKDGNCNLTLDLSNKRFKFLYDKFKDIVKTKQIEVFDTDDWDNTDVILYDDLPSHLKETINEEELCQHKTVLVKTNGYDSEYNLIILSVVTIKVKLETVYELPFFDLDYICRKSHKQDLYDKFLGTCWYDGEDSKIDEKDVREVVLFSEFEELKTCFEEDSNIHSTEYKDPSLFIMLDF